MHGLISFQSCQAQEFPSNIKYFLVVPGLVVFSGLLGQLKKQSETERLSSLQDQYEIGLYASVYRNIIQNENTPYNWSTYSNNQYYSDFNYLKTISSYNLGVSFSSKLMEEYLANNPVHSGKTIVEFNQSQQQYSKSKFQSFISSYNKIDINDLTTKSKDLLEFQYAISLLKLGKTNDALYKFKAIGKSTSEFADQADYYSGIISYNNEEYSTALKYFRKYEINHKDVAELKQYIALCMIYLNQFDEFESNSEKNQNVNNHSMDLIYAQGYYNAEKYQKAIPYFERYFSEERDKEKRTVTYQYAFSLYKTSRFSEALDLFKNVVFSEDTLSQLSSYYLGFCSLNLNDSKNAAFHFEKAGKMNFINNITIDARLQNAKCNYENQNIKESLAQINSLLKENLTEEQYTESLKLKTALFLASDKPQDAIYLIEKQGLISKEIESNYQQACYNSGLEYLQHNLIDSAILYLNKAKSINPGSELSVNSIFWLGESYSSLKDFESAKLHYEEFLRDPKAKDALKTSALFAIGYCCFETQDYNGSIEHFENFLNKTEADDERIKEAKMRIADSYFSTKNYSKALNYYLSKSCFSDRSIFMAAESCSRLGKYKEAVQNYSILYTQFKNSPYTPEALNNSANVSLKWLKDDHSAEKLTIRLLEEFPGNDFTSIAYNRLGIINYNNNNEELAVKYFKKVLTEYKDNLEEYNTALSNLEFLVDPDQLTVFNTTSTVTKHTPENENSLFEKIEQLFLTGEYEKVITLSELLLQQYPESKFCNITYYYKGKSEFSLDNFEKAQSSLVSFCKKSETSDEYPDAIELLGKILIRSQNHAKADSLLNIASNYLDLDKYRNLAFMNIENKMALGKYNESERLCENALNKFSDSENTSKLNLLLVRISILKKEYKSTLLKLEDIESSIDEISKPELLYYKVYTYYMLKDYKSSILEGITIKKNFPAPDLWKARAFLVVAEDYLNLENKDQALAILSLLSEESNFPDIQRIAIERKEIMEAKDIPLNDESVVLFF